MRGAAARGTSKRRPPSRLCWRRRAPCRANVSSTAFPGSLRTGACLSSSAARTRRRASFALGLSRFFDVIQQLGDVEAGALGERVFGLMQTCLDLRLLGNRSKTGEVVETVNSQRCAASSTSRATFVAPSRSARSSVAATPRRSQLPIGGGCSARPRPTCRLGRRTRLVGGFGRPLRCARRREPSPRSPSHAGGSLRRLAGFATWRRRTGIGTACSCSSTTDGDGWSQWRWSIAGSSSSSPPRRRIRGR